MEVALSAQLQQWTFEKSRPERSDSSASSPDLYNNDSETLRLDAAAVDDSQNLDAKESLFQDRYLSSEEDLSPMEGESDSEYDDDASIHEVVQQCFSARKMSISRIEQGKICDLAVTVSYVSAGRPKMIELANMASPLQPTAQRSASLAQLPIAAIQKLREADRASRRSLMAPPSLSSLTSRSSSPASKARRPSLGDLPSSHNNSSLHISDTSSFTNTSSRSTSPSASENSLRPATSAVASSHPAPRSSLYIPSNDAALRARMPPPTPLSPDSHSFLSSDPYENATKSAASPIIKSGPHKRLRSISMKLSLAKIAITPTTKKWDSRVNGRPAMPPTPATPYTPMTPMTAPVTSSFSSPQKNKLRRSSKASRPNSIRGPSPEIPPMPTSTTSTSPSKAAAKMVARGAAEREPILELPPCPDDVDADLDPMASLKSKRIRKRKSLMDLL